MSLYFRSRIAEPVDLPLLSRKVERPLLLTSEPIDLPDASRNCVRSPLALIDPDVVPLDERNVVSLLEVVADWTIRPLESRNVMRLPAVSAEPMVRPELSRYIVRFPCWTAVPSDRPEASRNVVRSPLPPPTVVDQAPFSQLGPIPESGRWATAMPPWHKTHTTIAIQLFRTNMESPLVAIEICFCGNELDGEWIDCCKPFDRFGHVVATNASHYRHFTAIIESRGRCQN